MQCITNTKTVADWLISEYVAERLAQALEFKAHIMECPYCSKNVLQAMDQPNVKKEQFLYEIICGAFNQGLWEAVERLGKEMEALDYSEDFHPIKNLVTIAKAKLGKLS